MTFKQTMPVLVNGSICCMLACAFTFAMPFSATAQEPAPDQIMPPGHPGMQAPSPQSLAAEGVRTSANIARAAIDICHIDPLKVARFKAKTKESFPLAPDFDGAWNLGYKEAQSTVDRLATLATTNPAEYTKEIGQACPSLSQGIDEATR